MKTLKCDLCDHEAEGETFEAWMEALKPHYMQAHADVMSDPSKTKEDMMKWMTENKERFDADAVQRFSGEEKTRKRPDAKKAMLAEKAAKRKGVKMEKEKQF